MSLQVLMIADHRLAGVVGAVVAHLRRARAMTERAQVLGAVPAMRAKIFRALTDHCRIVPCLGRLAG